MENRDHPASTNTIQEGDSKPALAIEDVLGLIPAMVLVYRHGKHVYVSPGSVAMTGFSPLELLGLTTADIVHPASLELVNDITSRSPEAVASEKHLIQLITKGGELKWVEFAAKTIDYHGDPAILAVCTDVTEARQTAARLQASEDRFKSFFDRALIGLAIGDDSLKGRFVEVNRAYERMLGYGRGELKGKSFADVTHPDDVAKDMKKYRALVAGDISNFRVEKRYIHKNGSIVHGLFTGILVRDEATGNPSYSFGIVQDITPEKNATRQLVADQRLLRQLLKLQDKERRLLALDIHDGLLQDISGAMFFVQSMYGEFELAGIDTPQAVTEAEEALSRAGKEGRRLIDELRPSVIENVGLMAAVRELIEKEHAGFPILIDFDMRVNELQLSEDLEGQVYRILQEALNNVRRHSQATEAEVRITQPGKFLLVEVKDNGIGFDPKAVPGSRSGVSGIHERARLFGGGATFETSPDEGTHLTVNIPIDSALLDAFEGYGSSSGDLRITH